jgi:Anti-sigma-K factor rskA
MTTCKRQIPDDGAEYLHTKLHRQSQAEADSQRAADPWYRRVLFWRAVAGMAVAMALGCAAVALETALDLSSRSASSRRRLELLGARISRLRSQAADAERQLAAMDAERTTRAGINHVLSATDVLVVRLTPGAGSHARGLLAISRQAGGAVLEIAGLPAGETCVMWWTLTQGPPAKAAEFSPDAEGRLSLAVQLPRGMRIAGAIVTLEPPKGRIVLRGMLPMAKVLNWPE